MLILTRNVGAKVMVGNDIIVTVVGLNHVSIEGRLYTQVRLGFDAPDNIQVHREEIYNRIKNEQLELYQWQNEK
jgi:carbon storage regulator